MSNRNIDHAALDAADRIMGMIAPLVPQSERAALWGRLFEEITAGIVAAVGAERQQERLEPGRN